MRHRVVGLSALFVVGAASQSCRSPQPTTDGAVTLAAAAAAEEDVAIAQKHLAPIVEGSGMCIRRVHPNGSSRLLMVSDQSYTVVEVALSAAGDEATFTETDVGDLSGGESEDSQFEAVACDSAGMVMLLAETDSVIHVLNKNLEYTQSIDLAFNGASPTGWEDEANSRGEGLLLLNNGHIAVLKEKKPGLIVEYGPEGEDPVGICAQSLLGTGQAFALPADERVAFVPLWEWEFKGSFEDQMIDFSDLAADSHGNVYVLSQEQGRIARIEGRLKPEDDKIRATAIYNLPQVGAAEGLVVLPSGVPVVTLDLKQLKNNVLVIDPIAEPSTGTTLEPGSCL